MVNGAGIGTVAAVGAGIDAGKLFVIGGSMFGIDAGGGIGRGAGGDAVTTRGGFSTRGRLIVIGPGRPTVRGRGIETGRGRAIVRRRRRDRRPGRAAGRGSALRLIPSQVSSDAVELGQNKPPAITNGGI